jgi:predicted lipoprotein with Yx(FWY)xxD motif
MRLTRTHRVALGASGAALALLLAACGGSSSPTATSGQAAPAVTASGALLASAQTALGPILVDGKGMTVYMFAADKNGKSVCDGSCASYWPPVPAPATLPASLTGVTAKLGSTTRDDGSKQLTVGGRPVYTYAGDEAPGDTEGQGTNLSGGLWWVLSPAGAVVKTKAGDASDSSEMSGYGSGY